MILLLFCGQRDLWIDKYQERRRHINTAASESHKLLQRTVHLDNHEGSDGRLYESFVEAYRSHRCKVPSLATQGLEQAWQMVKWWSPDNRSYMAAVSGYTDDSEVDITRYIHYSASVHFRGSGNISVHHL